MPRIELARSSAYRAIEIAKNIDSGLSIPRARREAAGMSERQQITADRVADMARPGNCSSAASELPVTGCTVPVVHEARCP